MAEAPDTRINRAEDRMTLEEIRIQFHEWHERLEIFQEDNERKKEDLLQEIEEHLTERLNNMEEILRRSLLEGILPDRYFNSLFYTYDIAVNLRSSLKELYSNEIIDDPTRSRFGNFAEQFTSKLVEECRESLRMIYYLDSYLHGYISLEVIPDIEIRSQDFKERCEYCRYPELLLLLHACMEKKFEQCLSAWENIHDPDRPEFGRILQIFRFGTKTLAPEKEQSYTCPENSNIVVKFPAGTVTTQENVFIQLEPVRGSKVPLTVVRGYTDTICIKHKNAFLKPVQVKLPLTRIEEVDLTSCEFLCIHFEEDEISIHEDVKVELLPGNICSFETNQFPRNGVYAMKKALRRSLKQIVQEIKKVYGMCPHIISVFIGKGYKPGTWRIHAEVLEQSDLQKTIQKRTKMGLMELLHCRSPSLTVVRVTKIKVSLSKDGPLALCGDYVKGDIAIEVIPGGEDQFTYFDVKKTHNDEEAKIIFNAKPSGKKLHTARFDPRQMNMGAICPDPSSRVAGIAKVIPGKKSGTNMLPVSESKKEKIKTTTTPSTVSPVGSVRSETPTGFFGDSSMLILAKQISVDDIREFAIHLGIQKSVYMDFKTKYSGSTKELKLAIMDHWLDSQPILDKMAVNKLCYALKETDLNRIAEIVKQVARENRDLRRGDFEK